MSGGNRNHLTIKDFPEAERPREKLHRYGVRYLTDAELLQLSWDRQQEHYCYFTGSSNHEGP